MNVKINWVKTNTILKISDYKKDMKYLKKAIKYIKIRDNNRKAFI